MPGDEPSVRQIGIQLLKQGLKNNGVGTFETILDTDLEEGESAKSRFITLMLILNPSYRAWLSQIMLDIWKKIIVNHTASADDVATSHNSLGTHAVNKVDSV